MQTLEMQKKESGVKPHALQSVAAGLDVGGEHGIPLAGTMRTVSGEAICVEMRPSRGQRTARAESAQVARLGASDFTEGEPCTLPVPRCVFLDSRSKNRSA